MEAKEVSNKTSANSVVVKAVAKMAVKTSASSVVVKAEVKTSVKVDLAANKAAEIHWPNLAEVKAEATNY